jgi:hypothetical protein
MQKASNILRVIFEFIATLRTVLDDVFEKNLKVLPFLVPFKKGLSFRFHFGFKMG